jgi:NAD(P)-dependent dehydrogenase (short-subunit alcohol dehydrogenase family)
MNRFAGAVAIVTGAGSGIGRATAVRLAGEGAVVVVADVREAPAQETVDDITSKGGRGEVVVGDVLHPDFLDELVGGVAGRHGRLDILHNNVGFGRRGTLVDLGDEEWARGIDGNLGATFRGIRAALRVMSEQRHGSIVNTASLSGVLKVPGVVPYYGVAKAGVVHLTREAAFEAGPYGVRVNAVVPGSIKTPAFESYMEKVGGLDAYTGKLPLRRMGRPEDIAAAVAFLASDDAAGITGVALPVDAGVSAVLAEPQIG